MIRKYANIDPLRSARIRNDSQVGKNWSATISKQSYNAKQH